MASFRPLVSVDGTPLMWFVDEREILVKRLKRDDEWLLIKATVAKLEDLKGGKVSPEFFLESSKVSLVRWNGGETYEVIEENYEPVAEDIINTLNLLLGLVTR